MVNDVNVYLGRLGVIVDILESFINIHLEKVERRKNNMSNKERTVFVVHGRNEKVRKALYDFLRSINLYPLEWESAVRMTGKGAPTTLEIIKEGMKNSNGVIVLYTGDDMAKLKEELWRVDEHYEFELQPRQNVLFEAGMAMALYPDSTLIVRVGTLREISDITGINYINLSNSPDRRQALIERLKTIGLDVDNTGVDWLTSGDFTV